MQQRRLSLDEFLGFKTRSHSYIDVFSTHIKGLLSYIESLGLEIYVANRDLEFYCSNEFQETDYNYWVSDGLEYKVQVLVYQLGDDRVYFRRNKSISWPKEHFIMNVNGMRIVNHSSDVCV